MNIVPWLVLPVLALFGNQAAGSELPPASQNKPSAREALELLRAGNRRFEGGKPKHPHADAARLALADAEDQSKHAFATVLCCSDSRVPPEMLFDAGVMDLFVVRVAGNGCSDAIIGSLEYGAVHVQTPLLVILGHTKCGAVAAAAAMRSGDGCKHEPCIERIVRGLIPAVDAAAAEHPNAAGEDLARHAVDANVCKSVRDLLEGSGCIRALVRDGKLKIAGGVYDLHTHKVLWLPEDRIERISSEVMRAADRQAMH